MPAMGFRKPVIKCSCHKRHATEHDKRCKDEQTAEDHNLGSDGAIPGIDKLREEREKEHRYLGIGNVHDDTATIELPQTGVVSSSAGNVSLFGPKRLPREIEEIASAENLERGEGEGRGMDDCGNPERHRCAVE